MKWAIVRPEESVPVWRVRDLPVADMHRYCDGEIIETVVRDERGRFWRYGDWVTDVLAYRVVVDGEVEKAVLVS